jgi:prepilin-type N-terminal cleavage/methylation domain-containing protein
MTKRFGFTLAEVLITLGIIGVVAAMTIPTLIANTNGAKFRSQFKKSISTLNQAGLMGQAQYDFDYAGTNETCSSTKETAAAENPDSKLTFCALLNGTLTGQTYLGKLGDVTTKGTANNGKYTINNKASGALKDETISNYLAYSLADGSIVAFNPNAKGVLTETKTTNSEGSTTTTGGGLSKCIGLIDVNGSTLPNKEVTCSSTDKATFAVDTPCVVNNDANHMTDVFPIVFHDSTVEPASDAAKYILTTSK